VARNAARDQTSLIVECGCGVGNALFPLLTAHPTLHGVGVDFSTRAIAFVKGKPEYTDDSHGTKGRAYAQVCDLATQPLAGAPGSGAAMLPESADLSLLCFVLSAVAPHCHGQVSEHVCAALKPLGAQ
jgi:methyltransferase-like protein 6